MSSLLGLLVVVVAHVANVVERGQAFDTAGEELLERDLACGCA